MILVKEAASSQSAKSRIDFYEAMWIFYRKHYQAETPWLLDKLILTGVVAKGALDVGWRLWRFCRRRDEPIATSAPSAAGAIQSERSVTEPTATPVRE